MTTDMTANQGQPMWEVYKVEDTYGPTSLGGSNRIKRVYFHVLGSSDSYIDVPFAEFNAANVAQLIDQHVANIIDVHMLKGQTY